MSIFDQNDNLDRCPITASVVQDTMTETEINRPNCYITEQQLEAQVSDILHYIYYSVKTMNHPLNLKWRFSLNIFGIIDFPDVFFSEPQTLQVKENILKEHSRIKNYLRNRFTEAGFEVVIEEELDNIVISLPYEDLEWPKAQQVFAQTIASNLVPVMPTPQFTPLMLTPSILRCDAIENEDDGKVDSGPYIK